MIDEIEITQGKLHTHYTKHFTIHENGQHTLHNHNTNCADITLSIPLSYLLQSLPPVFPSALHRFVLPYLHPVPPSSFPCCIAPWRRTQMRTKRYGHRGLGNTGSPNHRNYSRFGNSDVARRLIDIEEHEYTLATDDVPYVASCQSRFNSPEIIAVMGDVVRRMRLLKGTRAAICRTGFDHDLKALASATADEFMEAMSIAGPRERASVPPAVDQTCGPRSKSLSGHCS